MKQRATVLNCRRRLNVAVYSSIRCTLLTIIRHVAFSISIAQARIHSLFDDLHPVLASLLLDTSRTFLLDSDDSSIWPKYQSLLLRSRPERPFHTTSLSSSSRNERCISPHHLLAGLLLVRTHFPECPSTEDERNLDRVIRSKRRERTF